MKKLSIFLVIIFTLVFNSYASTFLESHPALDSDFSKDISCSGASTVYTVSQRLKNGVYYGVSYMASSTISTPSVKIELEQSFQEPTTEGASDTTYVVAEGASDIVTSLTDENWHHDTLLPSPLKFMRYKITGAAGNATDSQVYIYTSKQEFN